MPDKLSRIAKVRAPLPCSDCIALRKGVGTPMSREGSYCPLCTSALRKYLRLDELLVPRCADPRALPPPMILHAHVLTACVPLSCRLSAASWTACRLPAFVSHVGSILSGEGPERAPGPERILRYICWRYRCFAELPHVCSCFDLQLSLVHVPAMSVHCASVGSWCRGGRVL